MDKHQENTAKSTRNKGIKTNRLNSVKQQQNRTMIHDEFPYKLPLKGVAI